MQKIRLELIAALLVAFALISTNAPSKAFADCATKPTSPGFSVGSQSRAAVVTLCAHFVAVETKPVPAKPTTSKPVNAPPKTQQVPKRIVDEPSDPKQALKLWHRKLARAGETSFTPTRLSIRAVPFKAAPDQKVSFNVAHSAQFHTTFLLGRFVALRFIPLKVNLHFDADARQISNSPTHFVATAKFHKHGYHSVHGIVTYRAEYRLNGSTVWNPILGRQLLAAIATKVWVGAGLPPTKSKPTGTPLLVANDCLQKALLVGCLN